MVGRHPFAVLDYIFARINSSILILAGANSIIFQFEAMDDIDNALEFANDIKSHDMDCGISINPSTEVSDILPLLKSGILDIVDVLAVGEILHLFISIHHK